MLGAKKDDKPEHKKPESEKPLGVTLNIVYSAEELAHFAKVNSDREQRNREIAAELAVKSLVNWRAQNMREVMARAAVIETYLRDGAVREAE